MKLKWVGRYDKGMKMLRVARLSWNSAGGSYGTQMSLGLRRNKLFGIVRGYREVILTAFGVRIHYRRAVGGRFVA